MKLEPRDYQIYGINWLHNIKRGMLTDHPGLGKTLQSALAAEKPCLVVAPKYIIGQWADFLEEQFTEDKVSLANGYRNKRKKALTTKADWYIINYSMLRSYAIPLGIKTVIFDESHHLRNRDSAQSRAAYALVNKRKIERVYMLTASPMWKSVDDIWMQLHILYPSIFTSYHGFVNAFCVKMDTPWGIRVARIKKHMRDELDRILRPIKLGRTYEEAGRSLPRVIESVVRFTLDVQLRKAYDRLKENYKLQYATDEGREQIVINSSAVLHTLRAVTFCTGKKEAILEILEDNNKPTVIFWWYREHAESMAIFLKSRGIRSEVITGEIDAVERHRRVMRAQARGYHISATIASISEGVNLSAYRQIIYGEEHWPPGANYQSLSRVVRDRNNADDEPVLVYYVHARKTIDEGIHKIAKSRQASIKEVIAEALV